jgi:hypothetical protein
MNISIDELMEFQEWLMDLFYTTSDIDFIRQQFATANHSATLTNWLNSHSPEMLDVAARMTQHWGRKSAK